MDLEGNMHVFGRPVHKLGNRLTEMFFEDEPSRTTDTKIESPVTLNREDSELLRRVHTFLDSKIIQPCKVRAMRLPAPVVDEAIRLSAALGRKVLTP